METNFLKTAYAVLVALIVTFQLVAAPLALTAGATEQLDVAEENRIDGVVDFLLGECEDEGCGGS